ncbi:MAG: hypothetical protein Q9213_007566, partial [Squamulea squamosa]
MTRLFFLAACFAGALATYDYGGGEKNAGGDKMSADMSGQYMNQGADQKNAMDMKPGDQMSGDKSGEYMKDGGADQKNTMDMNSGSGVSILIVSKYKGGNAPMEQIAQPAMDKGMMHKVTVGGDAGLVFSPPTIAAMPGDMVEFTFMSKNHTVTQSTFPEPCKKMQDGVDSGFLPNDNNAISPPPTYMFQVKDQKPVWFYCKQKTPISHCGKGMTFSINPTAEKSHEKFTAMAMQQNGTAPAPSGGMDMNLMMSSSSSMSMPVDTNTMPPPGTTATTMPPPETTSLEAAMPATTSAPPPPSYMPPTPEQQQQPPASPPAAMPPAEMPPPSNLNAAAQPPAAAGGGMANNMVAGSGSMENGQ